MYAFSSIAHSDLSDDLTVCFEVLSCFFDHPSIDSTKEMLLHPFGNDVLMFRFDGPGWNGIQEELHKQASKTQMNRCPI